MRRTFRLVWLAVFAAWGFISYAQGTAPVGPTVVLNDAPSQANCPVSFWAQRYGLTAVLRETANGPVSEAAQSLRLRFQNRRTAQIERMSVVVYGRSSRPAMVLVRPTVQPDVVSRPMELTSKDGRFDSVQYVSTTSMPMITRIEIREIHYRDGTTWREPARNTCTAAPSLFVLVGAEANSR
jgi:hypothetical protein